MVDPKGVLSEALGRPWAMVVDRYDAIGLKAEHPSAERVATQLAVHGRAAGGSTRRTASHGPGQHATRLEAAAAGGNTAPRHRDASAPAPRPDPRRALRRRGSGAVRRGRRCRPSGRAETAAADRAAAAVVGDQQSRRSSVRVVGSHVCSVGFRRVLTPGHLGPAPPGRPHGRRDQNGAHPWAGVLSRTQLSGPVMRSRRRSRRRRCARPG